MPASHEANDQAVRVIRVSSEDTIPLRHSVLWPDMPREHVILPEDALGIHYGALLPRATQPVAVVSLFLEPLPIAICDLEEMQLRSDGISPPMTGKEAVRFRKFACDPQHQGRGLGTLLLLHALSMARSEMGVSVAWCDARKETEGWYKKRGFVSFGSTFFKGPIEYVRMRLDLTHIERTVDAVQNVE